MADEVWGFTLESTRVIEYVFMYVLLVSWDTQLTYTWSVLVQAWII